MAVNLAGDRLPCGHDIDQLWDHLTKGTPDEHARSCEYCQAALNEIRPLRTATSELAAEPVRPPADLSGKVMAGKSNNPIQQTESDSQGAGIASRLEMLRPRMS